MCMEIPKVQLSTTATGETEAVRREAFVTQFYDPNITHFINGSQEWTQSGWFPV